MSETIQCPKGWKLEKISDVCKKITSGGTPSRGNSDYFDGDIPWVKMSDMKKDLILDTKEKITKEGLENSSAKIFSKNTILLAMYTEDMGRTSILGIEGTTNQAICGLEVNSKILSKYLFYFLKSQKNVIDRLGKGGAQPNINQNKVKNLEIVFPENKDTQKKIIQKLDAILGKIEEKRKEILEIEKKQYLQKLQSNLPFSIIDTQNLITKFGSITLENLLNDARYGTSKKCTVNEIGIPVIRIPNIKTGEIITSNLKYSKFTDNELSKLSLKKGDLVICRTNGSLDLVGKSAIIRELGKPYAFASYLIRIRPDQSKINSEFLNFILSSSYARQHFMKLTKTTAGQFNINLEIIKSLKIPLVPISSQEKFNSIFKNRKNKVNEIQKLLEISHENNLKKQQEINRIQLSILNTAFSGKLIQ
jgi:type I restriction enzyme, S subunit